MGKGFLLFVVLIGLAAAAIPEYKEDYILLKEIRRTITQNLTLDNPFDAGEWGPVSLCPSGSFAYAFELKNEDDDSMDETAVNAIKLYCSDEEEQDFGFVTSSEGEYGSWYGMRNCSMGFLTGMRAEIEEYGGVFEDDEAMENLEMACNNGTEILTGIEDDDFVLKFDSEETWSTWDICLPGTAICGLQTRYEAPSVGDDVAIADVVMFCCEM